MNHDMLSRKLSTYREAAGKFVMFCIPYVKDYRN